MNNKIRFDAVIFDLDGVITKTAKTHALAWKKMFDEYLMLRETKYGEKFIEFNPTDDYLAYVDGKPRYNGVKSFLVSRGIEIPFGSPSDPAGAETCCGLGNKKNLAFNEVLNSEGVEIFPSTISLIKELKQAGIRLGVASSSKNCRAVLEKASLSGFFEVRVDGIVSAELGLNGKPEPDIFLKACELLGVKPEKSIVVEDAVSGVQAGARGKFGLTIGIARENNSDELLRAGAQLVVNDIAEINGINGLNDYFIKFSK